MIRSVALPGMKERRGPTVKVFLQTLLGRIDIEVNSLHAPITASNFLRYVDAGFYNGGGFYRAVTKANQPNQPEKIEIIQACVRPNIDLYLFPPIPLEGTRQSGLKHEAGTVSMSRSSFRSAQAEFFICLEDCPSLDEGGDRHRDRLGFAAFARVTAGMDVARAVQSANAVGQRLTPAVNILLASESEASGA